MLPVYQQKKVKYRKNRFFIPKCVPDLVTLFLSFYPIFCITTITADVMQYQREEFAIIPAMEYNGMTGGFGDDVFDSSRNVRKMEEKQEIVEMSILGY